MAKISGTHPTASPLSSYKGSCFDVYIDSVLFINKGELREEREFNLFGASSGDP